MLIRKSLVCMFVIDNYPVFAITSPPVALKPTEKNNYISIMSIDSFACLLY